MTPLRFFAGLALVLPAAFLSAQEPPDPTPSVSEASRQRYPTAWEVPVPPGTRLAAIKDEYERRRTRLPTGDLEDQSPLPFWFRGYMRNNFPDLPTEGPHQYQRVAAQILEWMAAHPNLRPAPQAPARRAGAARAAARVVVGTNINITNLSERNSESFIAVDYSNPQNLIAAANNIGGSGRQRQFYSSNGGATWSSTELPLAPGKSFNSDPALGWTTDGTAWAATLGIDGPGSSLQVQVFKSTDRGATWRFVSTVSAGNNNDKELMWIDNHATSPFKDHIYLAWDVPGSGGGMRFTRSVDKGATWFPVTTLSSDRAIGAHLSSGPSGEVYVAWPDTQSRQLRIRKSTNGGASFAAAKVIATTNDSYEVSVPAMCNRKVLIYVSIGVDRSSGPRKGAVYATWTDRNGAAADPGCTGITSASNSSVYFSASTDGGNTWSAPKVVHTDPAKTDQFNQWMDVDPDDGTIHVAFYDTRDNANRKQTHLYYVASKDGGNTWINETRVTTAPTDETASGADSGNQYGDYNGLVAYRNTVHPSWTDRRTGVPGGREQIFTARLRESGIAVFDICERSPRLCVDPIELGPGLLTIECAIRPCVVVDFLPKNCLVKFDCPGCPPGGLCPPFYHLFLDGLGADWEVSLIAPTGSPAPVYRTIRRPPTGVVVSFRPSSEAFEEGKIGSYALAFRLKPEGRTGQRYRVKASLRTGDGHYQP